MNLNAKTLKGVKLLNDLLREQNTEIRNRLDLRDKVRTNSLASLSGNPQFQTPITSFNPMVQNNIYAPITLDWTVLMYAYKTHGLIQTLCDMPVYDALRGGITLVSKQLDEDNQAKVQEVLREKQVLETIRKAKVWTRLFGGGGLIISTDRPSEEPLDLKQLARDGEFELYACNRWEIMSSWRIPTDGRYNFYGKTVDASRVITMSGKEAPYMIRFQLSGWGMSELERAIEDFNTYIRVKNVIYELLYEAKIDIYKFNDFAAQMLSAEAEDQTNKRMQIMNSQKNYNSALLLDKNDEYDQKQLTFAGLAEIYRESRIEISSAWRIPMSKLFGIPSTGFSSGEDDRENYHEMIESEVRQDLRDPIKKVLDLICVSLFGDTFDDLDFEFKPLRQLGAKEQEEVDTSKFARMMALYDKGLIDPEELGEMMVKEKLLDAEIELITNPEPLGGPMDEGEEGDGDKGGEGKE